MTKNLFRLWLALLIISGGIALWFLGGAASGAWKYVRLNTETSAEILQWEVVDLSPSRYAVVAHFKFEVGGKTYSDKTLFESPQFLNRFAAENYAKLTSGKNRTVWYRESNPSVCSLEREFPKKGSLQALLTIGVFAYFYFLKGMVSRYISL